MKKESPFKFKERFPKVIPVRMDVRRGSTHMEIIIPEDHVWSEKGKCNCQMCCK